MNAHGAGIFQIPIKLAPGTQNLHPELDLVYNSQSNHNGILGVGWSLNGLSSLHRCGKRYYADGETSPVSFDDDDRLCRDGARLRVRQGDWDWHATFQPEIADGSEIHAKEFCGDHNPCSFEAVLKDGRVLTYGGDPGARVQAPEHSRINMWLLSEVRDRNGNTMEIGYRAVAHGIQVPSYINYNHRRVRFEYEELEAPQDTAPGYEGGEKLAPYWRLHSIETIAADGRPVRKYTFDYRQSASSGRSLLKGIEECGGEGQCAERLTLHWNDATETGEYSIVTPTGGAFQENLQTAHTNLVPGDFDGDGRMDFIRQGVELRRAFRVYFSNGDGGFRVVSPSAPIYDLLRWEDGVSRLIPGDFNGDGKTDFLRQANVFDADELSLWISAGNGSFQKHGIPTHADLSYDFVNLIPGDFDGDGRTDFLKQTIDRPDDPLSPLFEIYYSQGDGSFVSAAPELPANQADLVFDRGAVLIPGDYDGDGSTDFVRQQSGGSLNRHFTVFMSRGRGELEIVRPQGNAFRVTLRGEYTKIVPGDFNGDGKLDLLAQPRGTTTPVSPPAIFFSKGDGNFEPRNVHSDQGAWILNRGAILMSMDANGDGRADLLRQELGDWDNDTIASFRVYLSNGDGEFTLKEPAGAEYQDWLRSDPGVMLIPGDYDGDGRADFIRRATGDREANHPSQRFSVYLSGQTGPQPNSDTIRQIEQGPVAHNLAYRSLSAMPVNDGESFEIGTRPFQGPVRVVKIYSRTAPGVAPSILIYDYSGATADMTGRGLLGFRKISVQDAQKLVRIATEYHLKFPLTGKIHTTTTNAISLTNPDGALLAVQSQSWQSRSSSGGHQLQMRAHETTHYQEAGSVIVRGETVYDGDGNPALVSSSLHPDVKTCTNYNRWGRPTLVTTGRGCSGANGSDCQCDGQILKRTKYKYDSNQNLSERSVWDDSNNVYLTESYEHDSYGNQIKVTNAAGVVEETQYDSYDTFPHRVVTDVSGKQHVREYTYDGRFGVVTRVVDANGNEEYSTLDGFGRLLSVSRTAPDGDVVEVEAYQYSREGDLYVRRADVLADWNTSDRRWTRSYMDVLGREVKEISEGDDGQDRIRLTEFHANGLVRREAEYHFAGSPRWTTYAYNERHQVESVTHPNGSVSSMDYAAGGICGASEVQISAISAGRKTITCKQGERVTRVRHVNDDGPDNEVVYQFDALGRMLRSSDAHTFTAYAYDSVGRKRSEENPDHGKILFQYDVKGRLDSSWTVGAEQFKREFTQDSLGRITNIEIEDGRRVDLEYDVAEFDNGIGRLGRATVTEAHGGESSKREFAYDAAGQVKTMILSMHDHSWGMAYQRAPGGQITTVIYPGGNSVEYGYTGAGFLENIRWGSKDYARYEDYSALGQPGKITYGNDVEAEFTYDGAGRLSRKTIEDVDDADILDHVYAWTAFNEIAGVSDQLNGDNTVAFEYNDLGYLSSARGPYGDQSYAYSAGGNLTRKNGAGAVYRGNAMIKDFKGAAMQYDAHGMLIRKSATDGSVRSYDYDSLQQLERVSRDGNLVGEFVYDAAGQRVQKTDAQGVVTIYVSPEYEINEHPDGQVLLTEYLNGPNGRVAANTKTVGSLSFNAHIQQGLRAELYNTTTLPGLAGYLGASFMAFVHHPETPARVSRAALETAGVALLLVFAYLYFRSARRNSRLGAVRRWLAWQLAARAILRPAQALAFSRAAGTAYMRRNRWLSLPLPLTTILILGMTLHCGNSGARGLLGPGAADSAAFPGAGFLSQAAGGPAVGTYYFHHNHVGSTSLITDREGRKVSHLIYTPFGEAHPHADMGRDIFRNKFDGKEWDSDAGLYYFNARYYDPETGRFLQSDSYEFGTSAPHAAELNRYAFAANNPVTYADPSGNFVMLVFLAVVVLVSIVMTTVSYGLSVWMNGQRWDWKTFGIAVGIGVAVGLLGAATGGAMYAGFGAFFAAETIGANIAIGMATGVINGALMGAITSVADQAALSGRVDWGKVGTDTAWSAGMGLLFEGAMSGYSGYHGSIRSNYRAQVRNLPRLSEGLVDKEGNILDPSKLDDLQLSAERAHMARLQEKQIAVGKMLQPMRWIVKRATVKKYGNTRGASIEWLLENKNKNLSLDRKYAKIIESSGRNDPVFNILGSYSQAAGFVMQGVYRSLRIGGSIERTR